MTVDSEEQQAVAPAAPAAHMNSFGPVYPTWEYVWEMLPAYRYARKPPRVPRGDAQLVLCDVDAIGRRRSPRVQTRGVRESLAHEQRLEDGDRKRASPGANVRRLRDGRPAEQARDAGQRAARGRVLATLPSLLVAPVSLYGSANVQFTAVYLCTDVAPHVPAISTLPVAPSLAHDVSTSFAADTPTTQLVSLEDSHDWTNAGLLGGGRDAAREAAKPALVTVRVGGDAVRALLNDSRGQRRRFRDIDAWNADHDESLHKKHRILCSSKPCRSCGEEQGRSAFRDWEWRKHKDDPPTCLQCEIGTYACVRCERVLPTSSFPANIRAGLHRGDDHGGVRSTAVCSPCAAAETFKCAACGEQRPRALFERDAWRRRNQRPPVCFTCHVSAECKSCLMVRGTEEFSAVEWKRRATSRGAVCLTCQATHECAKCHKRRDRTQFSTSAWEKRLGRKTPCLLCQFPGQE